MNKIAIGLALILLLASFGLTQAAKGPGAEQSRYGGPTLATSGALAPAGTTAANGYIYPQVTGLPQISCAICGANLTVQAASQAVQCPLCQGLTYITGTAQFHTTGRYEGRGTVQGKLDLPAPDPVAVAAAAALAAAQAAAQGQFSPSGTQGAVAGSGT